MTHPERHLELMGLAIDRDAEAQQALLAGDEDGARAAFASAAERYRESWDAAPPGAYGRLVGMLKAAILGGCAPEYADYAREALAGEETASVIAAYAQALAALVVEEDEAARSWAARTHGGSPALERAARAIQALASGERAAYADAVEAIVQDFEARGDHLTGVPIADTALMLQRLAAERGMATELHSPLIP